LTGKSVKCINCSANLDVPGGVNQIFCVYCGTQNLLADVLEIPGLTLICLSCNTKNKDDHLFCSKCGGKLKEKCPCCGQAHPFNTVFCPVKGLNIKEYKDKKPEVSSETKAEEFNSKGLELYKKQKYDEAIKYYDKAIEADRTFPQPWNNKGIVYYNQDRLEEAIKCYDKAWK